MACKQDKACFNGCFQRSPESASGLQGQLQRLLEKHTARYPGWHPMKSVKHWRQLNITQIKTSYEAKPYHTQTAKHYQLWSVESTSRQMSWKMTHVYRGKNRTADWVEVESKTYECCQVCWKLGGWHWVLHASSAGHCRSSTIDHTRQNMHVAHLPTTNDRTLSLLTRQLYSGLQVAQFRMVCYTGTSIASSKRYHHISEKYHTGMLQGQCRSQCISAYLRASAIVLSWGRWPSIQSAKETVCQPGLRNPRPPST